MNKTAKLLLVLSIAVNAIWLGGAAAGWFAFGNGKAAAGKTSGEVARGGGGVFDIVGALSPAARKEVAAALSTGDAAALRDKLRALGLPADTVREIVAARITSGFEARRRKIEEEADKAAAKRPYWRNKDAWNWDSRYTKEQSDELSRSWREEKNQITQILGRDGEVPSQAQIMYPYLPADKAEQFRDMEGDYYDMRRGIEREMSGFKMPGDAAKLKLLDDEHRRDIDAMLTPDEKMASDLRNSLAAQMTQRAFSDFDGTEEEYKTIFALQNELYEKYGANSVSAYWGDSGLSAKEREAVQKEVDSQIKDALGDERYADYVRAQRSDWRSLQAAARRFNLDADTVAQTYQARDYAAGEAARISGDASLSAEEKNEAYAALSEQASAQIKAALGDDVGEAYINNALSWLKKLPRGGNVEIDPKGNVKVTQTKK